MAEEYVEVEVDDLFGLPIGTGVNEHVGRQHPLRVNRNYRGSDSRNVEPRRLPVYDGEIS